LIVELPFGVSFLIVMVASTFVVVLNSDGKTVMLHCFVGWAEFANPASDIATMAVRNVIHVRKLFMRISLREFRRRSAQDAIQVMDRGIVLHTIQRGVGIRRQACRVALLARAFAAVVDKM
jgi:hypothetical protein